MKIVKEKVEGGRRFYYVDFGSGAHGRSSFRLWIHPSLVRREDDKCVLDVPKPCIDLKQGKSSNTWVLRPGLLNLFDVYVPCGFRGSSSYEILTPVECVVPYVQFMSPRGSLGISHGCLVSTSEPAVTFRWQRTGRLYGYPSTGVTTIRLDGSTEELDGISDICEIEDLAEPTEEV